MTTSYIIGPVCIVAGLSVLLRGKSIMKEHPAKRRRWGYPEFIIELEQIILPSIIYVGGTGAVLFGIIVCATRMLD